MGHRIDGDGSVAGMFTETPAPGQNATKVTDDWLNAMQEEFYGFLEAQGVTLVKADNTQFRTLMATLFSAAKKVAGDYEIETVLIPDSTNKKLMITNKQTGKQFTITETRAPAGATTEATHSLGCVAGGIDWIFDFSMHNYSGTMKGVFVLSVFNDDEKSEMLWVLRRRPTGESGYGTMEDYYMMRLTETDGLQINTASSEGATPTWVKVLTESNRAEFATAAQGDTADLASSPVDAGSSRHAGGQIKTKIITLSFGSSDSTKSAAHGISNASTNHRIISMCSAGNDGSSELLGFLAASTALILTIAYDNTNITGYRGATGSARTIYVTIMYV